MTSFKPKIKAKKTVLSCVLKIIMLPQPTLDLKANPFKFN